MTAVERSRACACAECACRGLHGGPALDDIEGGFVVRLFALAYGVVKTRIENGDHPEDAAAHGASVIDAFFDAQ